LILSFIAALLRCALTVTASQVLAHHLCQQWHYGLANFRG
jgi:hypothetical protein